MFYLMKKFISYINYNCYRARLSTNVPYPYLFFSPFLSIVYRIPV